MSMTGLAELLQSVEDHVFSVSFRKQPTQEKATETLQTADKNTFKDKAKLNKLSKDLIAGETC